MGDMKVPVSTEVEVNTRAIAAKTAGIGMNLYTQFFSVVSFGLLFYVKDVPVFIIKYIHLVKCSLLPHCFVM